MSLSSSMHMPVTQGRAAWQAVFLLAVLVVGTLGYAALRKANIQHPGGVLTHFQAIREVTHSVSFTKGQATIQAQLSGAVTFNDLENDVANVVPNAQFVILETTPGIRREIHFASKDGRLSRDYRINGTTAAFDGEARLWLATRIPQILRNSTINLDERAHRIHADHGIRGLLMEAGRIDESYARASYLNAAMGYGPLEAEEFEILLSATGQVSTDADRASVIRHIFDGTSTADRQAAALQLIQAMHDSYEISSLMREILPRITWGTHTIAEWEAAFANVSDAFNQRQILWDMLDNNDNDDDSQERILAIELSRRIGSDYDKRRVLERAAPKIDSSAMARAYLASMATIESPSDRSMAASAYDQNHGGKAPRRTVASPSAPAP